MRLSVKETVVFGMLGAVMYASKIIMEAMPNVHLLGCLIIVFTVVYGKKALYPIYIFVLLTGLLSGFAAWWLPYLYIWLPLWGAVMLLRDKIPPKARPIVYMCLCAAHGFLYGTLYAPVQALVFGMSLKGMLAWIVAGLPWDFLHGVSNFFCGILVCPMAALLKRAEKYTSHE